LDDCAVRLSRNWHENVEPLIPVFFRFCALFNECLVAKPFRFTLFRSIQHGLYSVQHGLY